ncbi:MAG: Verru_Chthon cassette protein D [Verrucomicrobiota bacterium]
MGNLKVEHIQSRRAFSLVELLVVLGIIGVLSTIAIISFGGPSGSFQLTPAANRLKGEINLARHQAMTMNSSYEIRFFQETAGGDYVGYQVYRVDADGNPVAENKPEWLPQEVTIPAERALSPILTESVIRGTQSSGGPQINGKSYSAFVFSSSGTLNDVTSVDNFLTLILKNAPRSAGALPDNYAALSIVPATGYVRLTQP